LKDKEISSRHTDETAMHATNVDMHNGKFWQTGDLSDLEVSKKQPNDA
jgi:hypothetical protein